MAIHDARAISGAQEPLAGLRAVLIGAGTRFTWEPQPVPAIVSLTVACDLREPCLLRAVAADGSTTAIDVGYASHAQRIRIPVPAEVGSVLLAGDAGSGVEIIDDRPSAPGLSPLVCAAQTAPADRRSRALDRLRRDALCQHSWMGGCVLDAFDLLATNAPRDGWELARRNWLAHYWHRGRIRFQDPRGRPRDVLPQDIEALLPLASIALEDRDHPWCRVQMARWQARAADDAIIDEGMTSTEGCYTVAYPMARLARLHGDAHLRGLALHQLRWRRDRLVHDGAIHLRHTAAGRSFRNWGRGICWYLLGTARTLGELGPDVAPDLAEHLAERCRWIMARQRPDGLWDNFLDEPDRPADTSGSAGICAALLLAEDMGLVTQQARGHARRCHLALGDHLEPDGWLAGVAPNNKRGEDAQHGTRRTVEPFALGLYGQLTALLAD